MIKNKLRRFWVKHKLPFILKEGVEFYYKGDTVLYIWPWNRKNTKCKFISLGFNDCFYSLKDMDDAWKDYFILYYDIPYDEIDRYL